jgi:hypothetical protein
LKNNIKKINKKRKKLNILKVSTLMSSLMDLILKISLRVSILKTFLKDSILMITQKVLAKMNMSLIRTNLTNKAKTSTTTQTDPGMKI